MNVENTIMNTKRLFTNVRRAAPAFLSGLAFLLILISGCELIDPTEVRNPQIVEDNLIGQAATAAAALQSARFGFADLFDNTAYFTDVVSDNYDNIATFISPNADDPRAIRADDLTLNGVNSLYSIAQRERAQITYFLASIVPSDPTAATTVAGDLKFYRGMAALILGENFAYAPSVAGGPALTSNQLIDLAITDFTDASTTGSTTVQQAALFALARANHAKGSVGAATTAANNALATTGGGTYLFSSPYDAATQVNTFYTFAVSRALNDIQPLPRLDFLDPKYTSTSAPIAALKAEEMYLILAEAELSANNLAGARGHMLAAMAVATGTSGGRASANFTDGDPRTGRPNADSVLVRASATAPSVAGLVKRRSGTSVAQKAFSNTSVDSAAINALTTGEEHLRMLHLLRQEIFFGEGRRMSDLGIRLPIIQREIETSPTIAPGDPGTTSTVPAYIPTGSGLDAFTSDATAGLITITNDMNAVLATNRIARFTMPF